jgi:hypothetical protein
LSQSSPEQQATNAPVIPWAAEQPVWKVQEPHRPQEQQQAVTVR